MGFVTKLVDLISDNSNFLILSPHFRSFGNSVEEIYFGLLYCYENNKKLILAKPYKNFLMKKVNISNIYLYHLEHNLIVNPNFLIEFFLSSLVTFLVGYAYLKSKLKEIFSLGPSDFHERVEESYSSYTHFGQKYLYSFSEKDLYNHSKWKDLEKQYEPVSLPKGLISKSEE